ncbi:hypothetical protein ACHQM5_020782 [Ranunculus cassubicifolius]
MPSIGSSSSNISNGNSFENFFEVWLLRQQTYLDQLVNLSSPQNYPRRQKELESLVGQVLSHYQHYYEAKSRVASDNVFLLFSPPWFSTFERTFLWIAGFKPALAFKILEKSARRELNPQQVEKVQRQKAQTRMMEKSLDEEMVKIQESIVGPTWMEIVRQRERLMVVDGELDSTVVEGQVDQAINSMKENLRDLVVNADFLRAATARELVDILNPLQAAKFLAATAQLQLRVRSLGMQKDADRTSP